MMARSPLAPVFSLKRFPGNCLKCLILELKFHTVQLKSLSYCLVREFLGSFKIRISASSSSRIQCHNDRNSSDKLRDQTEFDKVFRHNFFQDFAYIAVFLLRNLCSKTNGFGILSCLDDLLQSVKSTTADEQDVCRIDLDKFLMRMLSSSPAAVRWQRFLPGSSEVPAVRPHRTHLW